MREVRLDDLSHSSIKYGRTLIDSRKAPTHVLRRHDIITLERNPEHLGGYTEEGFDSRLSLNRGLLHL